MADKLVHFEVVGKDGPKLMQFYGQLFGWTVNAGIGGGISAAQEGSDGHLTFYVGVDDLQAALDKAESLGGKTVTPPMEIPNVVTFAMFTDPEGHLVGLVKN